ncbi:MAG: GatB/YqeY domain-containing protein [bacterium]
MVLHEKINQDFVAAFKGGKKDIVSVLRMLKSALQNRKIEKMIKEDFLSDEETLAVIKSEVKKRKDSAESYNAANRSDLAGNEMAEAIILEEYLPAQMPEDQLLKLVDEAIAEVSAKSASDFGKVIGVVMKKANGAADGQMVSRLVKQQLAK